MKQLKIVTVAPTHLYG